MRRSTGGRPSFLAFAITMIVGVLAAVILASSGIDESGEAAVVVPPDAMRLVVAPTAAGSAIPAGYLGLSFEFQAIAGYAGTDRSAVNPALIGLIRNLVPQGSPVIRIGGDSTDWTWWPARGVRRPGGASYPLTPAWLGVVHALVQRTNARLILGVNFEADNRAVARAEARAFVANIGRRYIKALELGNEPELYSTFDWYRTHGDRSVFGRPAGYGYQPYLADYAHVAAALPNLPLAGPAVGSIKWIGGLDHYLSTEPRVKLVTLHRYQLTRCFTPRTSPLYPTVRRLLAPSGPAALAGSVAGFAATAHAHHAHLLIDELNSVACAGAPNVSDTFASALWVLDALYAMKQAGVDGVNIHTFPIAHYGLFNFSHRAGVWRGWVHPEYYGLMMFAQSAPAGSRLLPVSGASGDIHAWATQGPSTLTRILLINDAAKRRRTVAIRVPGVSTAATVERLRAPGLRAKRGITLGGQAVAGGTTSGELAGGPQTYSVPHVGDLYKVVMPPASAALVTL